MSPRSVPLAIAALSTLAASTPTHAHTARFSIQVAGSEWVEMVHRDGQTRRQALTWSDEEDRACRATLDIEDLGELVFSAMQIQCMAPGGRELFHVTPHVLARWGEEAKVSMAVSAIGDAEEAASAPNLELRLLVERDGATPSPTPLQHRSFFAERGRSTYNWFSPRRDTLDLTCPEPIEVLGHEGATAAQLRGRFKPGDRVDVGCTLRTQGAGEQPLHVVVDFL